LPDEEEEDVKTKRDLELENIASNLMIAEYQVDKLKQRLSQQVRYIGYGSFGSKNIFPYFQL
jgi:hypothetical protein